LLDGSFWSNNELVSAAGKGQTAREMGHLLWAAWMGCYTLSQVWTAREKF